MSAVAAARSVLRFTAVRPAAGRRLASEVRPSSFTFRTTRRSPPSIRLSRSMSSVSLLPYRSVTASALINSKLSVTSSCAYVWTLDDG
ncbi:hypothetical protein LINGRAHAP2_LOCUS5541 [Linum grandiflorum]